MISAEELQYAKDIIKCEASAILQLERYINDSFSDAVLLCRNSNNIIVSGVGKNISISQKMSATLSSLGVKSFFVHPNDADHGDYGKICDDDVVICMSYSGETKEIISYVDTLKHTRKCKIISITGRESTLSSKADIALFIGNFEEAGKIKMVPSSSTTATLAFCDALALTVCYNKTIEDFSINHPGGNIGVRLSNVKRFMRSGSLCPTVETHVLVRDVIFAMTQAGAGIAMVCNNGVMVGIVTDGDIRRALFNSNDILNHKIIEYANTDFIRIHSSSNVEHALNIFKAESVGDIPVVDDNLKPIGLLSLKDVAKVTL